MITPEERDVLFICYEWFLFGKITVLCTLTCTLLKKSGLGIYSGIFVLYLLCQSPESRTANIVFYALCVLFILSTANTVMDLLKFTLEVSNNSISKNIIFLSVMQLYLGLNTLPVQLQLDLNSIIFRIQIAQIVLSGCCDVIGQCILVSTNHCTSNIHLTLQRSTDVGLCGLGISRS